MEFRTLKRNKWPPGPWDNEPDIWVGSRHNFKLCIVRNGITGHLNGYLAVPQSHPWWGRCEGGHLDNMPMAHGGITYVNESNEGEWVVGFDCAHAFDYWPGMPDAWPECVYRDLSYVKRMLYGLADSAGSAVFDALTSALDSGPEHT